MTKLRFEELVLSSETQNAITDMGFEEASPIQAEAIPLILEGKDIIGQAQTGTGKTAAFAIPVIEKLDPENKKPQAIVLCPTRELVIQVAKEFQKLLKYKENLSVVPVFGGQDIDRQIRHLKKGAQVVIGTPGRTMDHMRRRTIRMDFVQTVVLDEADEMLDMGFREDMEVILKDTPDDRQTIMFSATMAKDIKELTKKYLTDPIHVDVSHKKLDAPKIKQVYFEVVEKNKPELLTRLIDLHNVKLALVFCNTKSRVDELVEVLKSRGYFADALHGDMGQNQRERVMSGFRKGTVEILVATDVAGRGIDVNDIEAVFNYDIPRDDEDYIHRIGRTARAGKSGTAFNFVVGKEIYNLTRIQNANGTLILRETVPTMDELEETRINKYSSKISKSIERGNLHKYISQVEQLMGDEYTSLDVSAALLKMIMEKENEGFDRDVNFEVPAVEKRPSRKPFPGKKSGGKFGKRDDFKKNNRRKKFNNEFGSSEEKPAGFEEDNRVYSSREKRKTSNPFNKPSKKRKNKFKKDDKGFKSSERGKRASSKENSAPKSRKK